MDFLLDELDTDGALREAGEDAGISRATFLGGTIAGAVAAFAVTPTAEAAGGGDVAVLNFALTLEYLQASFYTEAERSKALHGKAADAATRLGSVERAHVAAFKDLLGRKAVKRPAFNFRGTTEAQRAFLKTAVAFEDLAVAAYKGQAPRLRSKPVLAAAVAIHSVEARHAAWMRYLFGVQPAVNAFDDAASKAEIDAPGGRDAFRRGARAHHDAPAPAFHWMTRSTRAAATLGVVATCAVALPATRLLGGADDPATPHHALPASPKPALARAGAESARCRGLAVWTSVLRSATARARPQRGAHPVARLSRRTPEGSANVVLVIGRAADARGRVWVRTRLAALPNGTTGWVPRRALGAYETVRTRLIVDRREADRDAPARRAPGVPRRRRRRAGGLADAARAVLHPQPADAVSQRHLRAAGVRDERPLGGADGLARGRIRRHPRDRPAGPAARARLARMHPYAQPRHPPARARDGRRHAGDDPLTYPRRGDSR